ncbi:MAG: beta-propeller domain-containing protein [Propionibacteriaceae bacterium]|nr:beta-propeller domain-containing protein [Propionibacteriaceae bacterium]
MNDIFKQLHDQMKPRQELLDQLDAKLKKADEVPVHKGKAREVFSGLLAAACFALLAGVVIISQPTARTVSQAPSEGEVVAVQAAPAADYAELYSSVKSIWDQAHRNSGWAAPEGAPQAMPAGAASSEVGVLYSGTNVQVEGIDEGDIVKTDGKTIFVVKDQQVLAVSAEGADSKLLSTISVADDAKIGDGKRLGDVQEMMLAGNRLVVVASVYNPTDFYEGENGNAQQDYEVAETRAYLYDISAPNNPKYVSEFGQSGSYKTTRLLGNTLYLVTEYVIGEEPVEAVPESFVPQVSTGGTSSLMDAAKCQVAPEADQTAYSVTTGIDLTSAKRTGELSVLGGAETVYMSETNLYLAKTDWNYTATTEATNVQLARISLNGGVPKLEAQAKIPGYLLNQFALDEYEGYLRVATTTVGNDVQLTILDSSLSKVGQIKRIAKDEALQSVRFMGAVGYAVSFKQTDPLFALDLANPAKPKVISELKLPGFSSYLHPWGDGLLLGLGFPGDENGTTQGIKLSMFDVSDPASMKEIAQKVIKADYSPATDDHKAIYVDVERSLIGFAAGSYGYYEGDDTASEDYLVYSYADGKFKKVGEVDLADIGETGQVRGLQIGDGFYVAGPKQVGVYTLDGLREVGAVGLG